MAAREWLEAALATFDELGATAWRTRARDELAASGSRRREAVAAREHLTPRESQIAFEVAQGRTNKEVAAVLYLTPKTVEYHLTRVFRKLDVSSGRNSYGCSRRIPGEGVEWPPKRR